MSDKLIGKSLDDFVIEGTLGKGGMGVVYRATESALHRQVAIKVLPDHLAENKSFIARFHREARAVAQLNHPNVVTVHRVGQAMGFHYIAMEYIKGGELKDLMKEQGQLTLEKSVEYVRQSASALNGAHTMGILHRDIKPQNIMIDEHDRVKVMDFGIAKLLTPDEDVTALTMDGTLLGTPTHMSPEQCQGDAVDQRADIYALGIVLYQCLAGELPFRGETPLAVIQKILNDEIPDVRTLRPDVPASLAEVVKKATAKDREERYATAADFERDLKQCQKVIEAGVALTKRMCKARPFKKKGESKSPVLLIAGLILLIAAGAVVYFLFLAGNSPENEVAVDAPTEKEAQVPLIPEIEAPEQEVVEVSMPEPEPEPELTVPVVVVPPEPVAPPPPKNNPPVAEIGFSADEITEGDAVTIYFRAQDPDDDALRLSYRVKGDPWWTPVNAEELLRDDFAVGQHTLEFRVSDGRGDPVEAENQLMVKAKPEPIVAPVIPKATGPKVGQLAAFNGHGNTIMAVAADQSGKRVVSGAMDNKLYIWDASETEKPQLELDGHYTAIQRVEFSKNGKLLLSGDRDGDVICWNAETGELITRFQNHHGSIVGLCFYKDGKHGLSVDREGNAISWELKTGSEVKRFNVGKVTTVAFAPEKNILVSGGQEQYLGVWNFDQGSRITDLRGDLYRTTLTLAVSPDGKYALSGGQDKRVRLWNLTTRSMEHSMEGHDGWVQCLDFLGDRKLAISGGKDNVLHIWDLELGESMEIFRNHAGSVISLDVSTDGKRAVSGSSDKSVRLWVLP